MNQYPASWSVAWLLVLGLTCFPSLFPASFPSTTAWKHSWVGRGGKTVRRKQLFVLQGEAVEAERGELIFSELQTMLMLAAGLGCKARFGLCARFLAIAVLSKVDLTLCPQP